MSGFPILDLVIGLIFIYFLMSIMCSAIIEVISNMFNMRAKILGKWFVSNFSQIVMNDGEKNKTLGKAILSHSLIQNLTRTGRKLSYVPKEEFAAVLLDIIVKQYRKSNHANADTITPYSGKELLAALEGTRLLPDDLKRILLQYVSNTIPDYEQRSKEVIGAVLDRMEIWYEKAQHRVTGWYKKRIHLILFFVAIIVTFAMNVDSISIARYLYQNPQASIALADAAQKAVKDSTTISMVSRYDHKDTARPDTTIEQGDSTKPSVMKIVVPPKTDSAQVAELNTNLKNVDTLYKQLVALRLPIGWHGESITKCPVFSWIKLQKGETLFSKIAGLFMTVFALSLGTPFWFDLLNKLVNLRGAGPKPDQQKVPPQLPDK
jgi:hypothetical protein